MVAALLALAPAGARAEGGTAAARSAAAAFVFSNQATQNAIVKAMDDDLLTQRRRADGFSAQLASARAQLASAQASRGKAAQLQAQLDQLSRDTAAAQEQFATALAAKDEAYAHELAALRDAADTILATPGGVHLLELANAGDWQGAKSLETTLRAARQKRRDLDDAAEERALAVLAMDAADKGREQVGAVIARYEDVTRLDPSRYEDWLTLAVLYRKVDDLSNAGRAATAAARLAATDSDHVAADLISADIDTAAGDPSGALAAARAGLGVIGGWLARDPTSLDAQRANIATLTFEAQTLQALGDLKGAIADYRKLGVAAVAVLRSGHASQADVENADRPIVAIAQILLQVGRPADALSLAVAQIAMQRSFVAARPDDLQLRLDLAVVLVIQGDALEAQKDLAGARAAHEEALAIDQAVVAKDPTFAQAIAAMATDLDRVARIQAEQGDLAAAAPRFEQELKLRRELAATDSKSAEHPLAIAITDGELAEVYKALGQRAAAIAASQEALQVIRALAARDPSSALVQGVLADATKRASAMSGAPPEKDHP